MLNTIDHDLRPTKSESTEDTLGINNPVAKRVQWHAMHDKTKDFLSHRVHSVSPERLELRRDLKSYFLGITLMAIGLFSMVVTYAGKSSSHDNPFIAIIVGSIFFLTGLLTLFDSQRRIVFDKSYPALWHGGDDPENVINPKALPGFHSLKGMHALQLIKALHKDDDGTSTVHELYLVFDDASRIYLLGHQNGRTVTKLANRIGTFLNLPVWDGREAMPAPAPVTSIDLGKPFDIMVSLLWHYYFAIVLFILFTIGWLVYKMFF